MACAQWTVQPSGTSADLHGISALSDQVAWVVGAHGTVLRTADGGSTWARCNLPAEAALLDFRAVQAFDPRTAVIMSTGKGELSRVYRTVDGCKSWEEVFRNPDPDGSWVAMRFQYREAQAPQKGYFAYGVLVGSPVGGEYVLFTSKDYGTTWRSLQDDEAFAPGPSAKAMPGEAVFENSANALTPVADGNSFAFVAGSAEGVRLLMPQGETYDFDHVAMKYTFSQVQLPLLSGPTAGAYSVGAHRVGSDRVDLMVVGGDTKIPDEGTAVFVKHGGPSLKKFMVSRATAALQPPSGLRTAVAFSDAENCWMTVGPTGTDISRDDGRTWTALKPSSADAADADKGWTAMSLPFVVGPSGRIGKLRAVAPGMATVAGR